MAKLKAEADRQVVQNMGLKNELEASQKSSDVSSHEIKSLMSKLQAEQELRMQSQQELDDLKQNSLAEQPAVAAPTPPLKAELAEIQNRKNPHMGSRFPAVSPPAPPPLPKTGQSPESEAAPAEPPKTTEDVEIEEDVQQQDVGEKDSVAVKTTKPEDDDEKDQQIKQNEEDTKAGGQKQNEDAKTEKTLPQDDEKDQVDEEKPVETEQKVEPEEPNPLAPTPSVPAMFKQQPVAVAKAVKANPPPPPRTPAASTPKSSAKRTGISELFFFLGWSRKCDKYKKLWI